MKLKGMKVFITGADGFIGSHLVEQCLKEGAKVRAFVYYNSFGRLGWLDSFSPKVLEQIDIRIGDIRDFYCIHQACKDIDIVFHLAALIGIPYSYVAPESYVATNVTGTLNVLQAGRMRKVKKIIHTSTSEVYGTAQYAPIDESHPINPQSPYAATKSSADSLALSFYRSFGLPVTVLRPFNTYGPRQSARAVIPTIMSQIASGHRTIKLGNLAAMRDLNYVSDTVNAFIHLAKTDKGLGEVFNAGSGREVSIAQLVEMIKSVTDVRVTVTQDKQRVRPKKSEVERLICGADKLNRLTGWRSEISLEKGLEKTYRWIAQNKNIFRTERYYV